MTYALIETLPDGREHILGYALNAHWDNPAEVVEWTTPKWATRLAELSTLVDGKWREVAPLGISDYGDIGGDGQLSAAWGQRFALRTPDGLWAVVDHFFYVETDVMHESGTQWLTEGIWRTRCRHLSDVGGTEEWADVEYNALNTVGEVTDRDAYGRAELLTGEYEWDGSALVR